MLERQRRINEVYEYLHNKRNIHTKKDFADAIEYAYPYVSSALNGNEKYLTDKLMKSICSHFSEISLDYLLNGEGELLLPKKSTAEQQETNILELYAHMIRSVDDLRQELKKQIAEVQSLNSELLQQLAALKGKGITYQSPDEAPRLAAEEIKK